MTEGKSIGKATQGSDDLNVAMNHEGRLGYLEGKLDSFATREDLQKELGAMTWKIISAIAALVAAVVWIVRNVPMSN